ncbi:MAG: PEGA domain-containing protein [Candidatus Methylomirabilales bacterium]
MRSILVVLGLLLLVSSCASTMMVFTKPGDAEIYVDGEMIGRSPVLYAGESSLDGGVKVTARLPGYQERTVLVSREANAAHLGESVLFPFVMPWGWYLPDAVHIQLEPVSE